MANPVAEFFGLTHVPPFDANTIGVVWAIAALFVVWETILLQLRERRDARERAGEGSVAEGAPAGGAGEEPGSGREKKD